MDSSVKKMNIILENIVPQTVQSFTILLERCKTYLVGSRAKQTHHKSSDYDYILLINQELDIELLQKLSQKIAEQLCEQNTSVKVFDLPAFANLYQNDYFRFLEYKLCLLKTKGKLPPVFEAFRCTPKVEDLLVSFVHAVIIQTCWSFAIMAHYNNKEEILAKLKKRFYINLDLFHQMLGEETYTVDFLLSEVEKHILYSKLLNFDQNNNLSDFFQMYFESFIHEKINKSVLYRRAFIDKKEIVKQIINNFNLNVLLNDGY